MKKNRGLGIVLLLAGVCFWKAGISETHKADTTETAFAYEINYKKGLGCYRLKINSERLDCYDDWARRSLDLKKKKQISPKNLQQKNFTGKDEKLSKKAELSAESFGLSARHKKKTFKQTEFVFAIKEIKRDVYKRVIVLTENGQAWRQVGTERIPVSKKSMGQALTVWQKRFGGYRARIGKGKSFYIQREK